jgi:predicted nucleic acid-binding protein
MRKEGDLVEPAGGIGVCSDPDDDMFLECAEAAGADYLVTGNKRHFPDSWKKTKIVTAREFVTMMADIA